MTQNPMIIDTLETRNLMSATPASVGSTTPTENTSAIVMSLNGTSNQTSAYGLNAADKHRVEQITSTFENSTTELNYSYCENIEDGRGYTAGRAGFCSGTGDMLMVVERYATTHPNTWIAGYTERLQEIDALPYGERETTEGLDGLDGAWADAAQDPAFRAVQDAVVDELYYQPAMDHAKQLGLTYAISKGQIYDAIIQHGDGEDHDGLSAMIDRANSLSHGTPATGINEKTWLNNFLTVRKNTLNNATDPDTREPWRKSVSRVEVYVKFLAQNNTGLTGELKFNVYGEDFVIPATSSNSTPNPTPTPAPTPAPTTGTGSISGVVWFDEDENGRWNGDENGNAHRTVFIDADNDHYMDTSELRTTTDNDGWYQFTGLKAGTYTVSLNSSDTTYSTTPIHQSVNVTAGHDAGDVDFGEWVY